MARNTSFKHLKWNDTRFIWKNVTEEHISETERVTAEKQTAATGTADVCFESAKKAD